MAYANRIHTWLSHPMDSVLNMSGSPWADVPGGGLSGLWSYVYERFIHLPPGQEPSKSHDAGIRLSPATPPGTRPPWVIISLEVVVSVSCHQKCSMHSICRIHQILVQNWGVQVRARSSSSSAQVQWINLMARSVDLLHHLTQEWNTSLCIHHSSNATHLCLSPHEPVHTLLDVLLPLHKNQGNYPHRLCCWC